jgi:type IV pilus assembly protein PilB
MKEELREKLGETLIRQKLLTQEQLEQALEAQKKDSRPLGVILLDKKLVSVEKLLEILALQKDGKGISLLNVKIPHELVKIIPEALARRFMVIPVEQNGKILKVVMADPKNVVAIDTLASVTGFQISAAKGEAEEIFAVIVNLYYGQTQKADPSPEVVKAETSGFDTTFKPDDPPVVRFVDFLMLDAVGKRASDIHLEPAEKECSVRFRIDGALYHTTAPHISMYPGIVSRIKILSGLDIAERRLPQDGRCQVKLGQKAVDLRVSTFPTVYGEKIVIRLLDSSGKVLGLEDLDMQAGQLVKVKSALEKTQGIILITGPTGSGKSTTLYSALSHLNNPLKNIVTVEDPVEYRLKGVNQTQVQPEIGLTFAKYLRHILRQDPNIIMIGEIRDLETAEIAIRAALTGHLVLSSIHTNDSVSTINRLVDMGIAPYLLPPSLRLIVAQRLIRKLCPECKTPAPPSDLLPRGTKAYQPKGCPACNGTGYWGRIGVFEVLEVTPGLKRLIVQGANYSALLEEAKKTGLKSLFEIALGRVSEGITSLEEVLGTVENTDEN